MPEPLPEIQVLLATYNGDRFLREQIDSILAQTYRNVRILARDDGSRDSTPDILRDYAARHPDKFTLLPDSTPTGSAQMNFKQLLLASTAPYVAFSDQDDVWLPQKLELSMAAMRDLESRADPAKPLLIFTDLRVVDEQLRTRADSFWHMEHLKPESIHKLRLSVARNVVTGCTMLLNGPLADLTARMPPDCPAHDCWAGLLAQIFGSASYVDQPTILYRQHGENVVGARDQPSTFQPPRLRDHTGRARLWKLQQQQARLMLQHHGGEMPAATRDILENYVATDASRNRITRIINTLSHGFLYSYPRLTIGMLWYLWDCEA